MKQAEALQQLRDLHLPPPVSWWPPAPGWWVLAALLLAALAISAWYLRRRARQRWRRSALRELDRLRAARAQGAAPGSLAAELSILLRRVAITRYGRDAAAGLHGGDWLAFLQSTGAGFGADGSALLSAPYRRAPAEDLDRLFEHAGRWIGKLP